MRPAAAVLLLAGCASPIDKAEEAVERQRKAVREDVPVVVEKSLDKVRDLAADTSFWTNLGAGLGTVALLVTSGKSVRRKLIERKSRRSRPTAGAGPQPS